MTSSACATFIHLSTTRHTSTGRSRHDGEGRSVPFCFSLLPPVQTPFYAGDTLTTRSFVARPTETGYDGIYIHFDGSPSASCDQLEAAAQDHARQYGRHLRAAVRAGAGTAV